MKTTLTTLRLLVGVFLVCILGSCSGWQKNTPETNAPFHASATYSFSTNTPRPTVTLRPSKTATITLTPTIVLSPTSSATPLPTLEVAEAQKKLNFMVYQNGGCELPCWWGIVPGMTRQDDFINVMNTFVTRIENTAFSYETKMASRTTIYYKFENQSDLHAFEVLSVDGIVQRVDAYSDVTERFTLANILRNYGKPEEILLATEPASPTGDVPFSLILFYPEKGILAHFYAEFGGRIKGDYVSICPQYLLPALYLWPSGNPQQSELEKQSLIESINIYYTNYNGKKYKSLEAVSEFSIDKFYAMFQQKNTTSCITTEAEQWWSK